MQPRVYIETSVILTEAGDDLDTYLAQARQRAEQGGRVVAHDIRRDRTRHERNNRPNAANRAEETLRTSLWQSGTRRC